jgi:hypothetical protein
MRNVLGNTRLLLNARLVLLVHYQAVENGQNLFAITVDALQRVAKSGLEIGGSQPFVEHGAGDIDILAQMFHGVTAQEQAVEKRRLPLRG